jgi:hypothetical protein
MLTEYLIKRIEILEKMYVELLKETIILKNKVIELEKDDHVDYESDGFEVIIECYEIEF